MWSAIRANNDPNSLNQAFGPGEPLQPVLVTPPNEGPRYREYPISSNLHIRPRAEEARTSFEQLRLLAQAYDVIQICHRALSLDLTGLDWAIQPKHGNNPNDKVKYKSEINSATQFLTRPDGDMYLDQWVNMLLIEDLEIGAPAIWKGRTRRGKLGVLDIVQGDTLKPVIDIRGKTVAFQQIWRGLPANLYPKEAFIYHPRIRRRDSAYGVSPVELIMLAVNTALRRQAFELSYFTKGNVPAMMAFLDPATWTLEQLKDFQIYFDDLMSGNDGKQHSVVFTPSDPSKTKQFAERDPDTKQQQWLLQITCAIHGVAPEEVGFTFDTNRATADSQKEASKRKGIIPLVAWIEQIMTSVVQDDLGYTELAFKYRLNDDTTVKDKTDADVKNIKAGVYGPGFVRERDGIKLADDDPVIIAEKRQQELAEASHASALEMAKNPQLMAANAQQPGGTNANNPSKSGDKPANDGENTADAGKKPANAGTSPADAGGSQANAGDENKKSEKIADLRRWKEKSINRVKAGKSASCAFESDVLGSEEIYKVSVRLSPGLSVEGVRGVFAEAIEELV